ncbi:MAG: hypothetical protein ACYCQJ_07420 [Nitrososphaerales archaeon]
MPIEKELAYGTFVKEIGSKERAKIPTTFVPLCPEKIGWDKNCVDLLCGVFHIMWSDMPNPRTYGVKLSDQFSKEGRYLGSVLVCTFPRRTLIALCK